MTWLSMACFTTFILIDQPTTSLISVFKSISAHFNNVGHLSFVYEIVMRRNSDLKTAVFLGFFQQSLQSRQQHWEHIPLQKMCDRTWHTHTNTNVYNIYIYMYIYEPGWQRYLHTVASLQSKARTFRYLWRWCSFSCWQVLLVWR